jgi:hypothetical protein
MTINRDIAKDRNETLQMLSQLEMNQEHPISSVSWLGHTGKCACIDWMLLYGADYEELKTSGRSVSSINDHIRHLKNDHGILITKADGRLQYNVDDLKSNGGSSLKEHESISVDSTEQSNQNVIATDEPCLEDDEGRCDLTSTVILDPAMVYTVAKTTKYFVDSGFDGVDRKVAEKMINLGVRTIHDNARSPRGKGKYLGHDCWSRTALMLLEENGGTTQGITKKLSHEHAIPVSYLVKEILFKNAPNMPVQVYKSQIVEFSAVAIITRVELGQLNSVGYTQAMPPDWLDHGAFARYKLAGIFNELQVTSIARA